MAGAAVPYKRFADDRPFDAIVIGSGIGGLATAALLAKAGKRRVLVLERHYVAGGLTHVFRRPGFEWDVGVHYVGQVHERDSQAGRLFDYLTEGRLAWEPMSDVYDRIIVDGLRFDYVRGQQHLRDALVRDFPREARAIDAYFGAIRRCLRRLPLFFLEKALPVMPSRLVGRLLRAPFLALARQTTADVLGRFVVSPELKAVLTAQWGDYGLPPGQSSFGIHALVTSHYFEGASYPRGGASQIAASLLPTIERPGGAVVVDAAVERVLIEGNRAIGVRMHDGREFRAACVISDAGVRTTLERLLPPDAPGVERAAVRTRALPASLAHLCLYVGLDSRRITTALETTNLWVHPGLDFDHNLSHFVADREARFPFLFISFPSAKDPTFRARYPGADTIEVVTMAPYSHFSPWAGTAWHDRGGDYEELKDRMARRLLAELNWYVPGIADAITSWELSTPLSTRHFLNAAHGEIYGVAHSPARFESPDLRPRTPIRSLYLTGQDVGTCGVMGALSGAVVTASVILRRNLFATMPASGGSATAQGLGGINDNDHATAVRSRADA